MPEDRFWSLTFREFDGLLAQHLRFCRRWHDGPGLIAGSAFFEVNRDRKLRADPFLPEDLYGHTICLDEAYFEIPPETEEEARVRLEREARAKMKAFVMMFSGEDRTREPLEKPAGLEAAASGEDALVEADEDFPVPDLAGADRDGGV
jgi:hypothetical protein